MAWIGLRTFAALLRRILFGSGRIAELPTEV
jgi:hypothetical protein